MPKRLFLPVRMVVNVLVHGVAFPSASGRLELGPDLAVAGSERILLDEWTDEPTLIFIGPVELF